MRDRRHFPSRRRFIALVTAGAGAALLTACGAQAPAPPAATTAPARSAEATKPAEAARPPASPGAGASPAAGASPSPAASPAAAAPQSAPAVPAAPAVAASGELKVGIPSLLLPTLDYKRGPDDSWRTISWGMGETLTRLNTDMKLEPSLAEKVESVDPLTWRITLRPNVRFWDGSPMNAQAVEASMKESWEKYAGINAIIPKETQFSIVDERTFTLKTPQPLGDLPYNLSSQFFLIHKRGPDAVYLTGQYKTTKLEVDQFLELEPNPLYWGPPAKIKKITARLVPDQNTRMLALQSGDLDMVWRVPPRILKDLGAAFETPTRGSTRTNMVLLNHAKPPFNDHAVREAASLGLDRKALLEVGYDGLSEVVTGVFPNNVGVDVVDAQSAYDPAKAAKLLDEAGWLPGTDGVRARGTDKLAFTLYSFQAYSGEFTPMAVSIQEQLRPLGFKIEVQEVRNITDQVKGGDFQAAMWSLGTLVNGDAQYMFAVSMVSDGQYNFGKYSNAKLDALMPTYRAETDQAKRAAFAKQAQELVRDDYPYLWLSSAPMNAAFKRGKVSGFTLHPNDLYFMQPDMGVTG